MTQRTALVWNGPRIQQLQSGDSFLTGQTPGRRNCVINGNFDIWQPGTSFTGITNTTQRTADMWLSVISSGTIAVTQETSVLPTISQSNAYSQNSLKVALTSGHTTGSGDYCELDTRIEGPYFQQLAQKSMTLSFWVRSSLTGIYCVALQNGGSDRSYFSEYTVNSANTWEKKTISIPASPSAGTWTYTDGTVGLILRWTLAAGSNFQGTAGSWASSGAFCSSNQVDWMANGSTFYLAQVQLEQGDSPSLLEISPNVLFDCQRYYYKSFINATAPAQNVGSTTGAAAYRTLTSSSASGMPVQFPNPMASSPTMTYYNPSAANTKWRNTSAAADSGTSGTDTVGTRGAFISNAGGISDTPGNLLAIHLTADARL